MEVKVNHAVHFYLAKRVNECYKFSKILIIK